MKTAAVVCGVLLVCLVVIQARHVDKADNDKQANDEYSDNIGSGRDYRASQMRHRRKRWQSNYGYDFPPLYNPYYSDRRDNDRNQDLIPQIYSYLDEILAHVKRPPPPPLLPQVVYVPYPVPYPMPQNCTCSVQPPKDPAVPNRFPDMDDTNQNWGILQTNEDTEVDDGTDGARPISFDPIKPIRPMKRPAPEVEHGSIQSSHSDTTQAPKLEKSPSPGACSAAILTCCSEPQKRQCFTRFGCSMTYGKSNACSTESIFAALEAFKAAYAPA